nr:phosphoglycerate kinase [Anaerolineae bacterium]
MNKKTIRDIDLAGKRVLVRVDFNVPIQEGMVTDDTRIVGAAPTLKAILEQSPRSVILMSHLGRPKGERNPDYTLEPVVPALSRIIEADVVFIDDCVGDAVESALAALPDGAVALLENTRFYKAETENDPDFAQKLARLGDIYVNDAFGSAHRAHASTEGVARHLPAVAGLLMEKEIEFLGNAIANPARPFVAILGGAKISGKIEVIGNLLQKADRILIGGGMANTFFAAGGREMAESLVDVDALDIARETMSSGAEKIVLPLDALIADRFDPGANTQYLDADKPVPEGWQVVDIGVKTIEFFSQKLADAMTIVWNGPMGVFEMEPFSRGTLSLAEALVVRAQAGAAVIIGGGDSAAAINQAGLADKVTHVSTGGGASLEMLEGKTLPGLAALDDR